MQEYPVFLLLIIHRGHFLQAFPPSEKSPACIMYKSVCNYPVSGSIWFFVGISDLVGRERITNCEVGGIDDDDEDDGLLRALNYQSG